MTETFDILVKYKAAFLFFLSVFAGLWYSAEVREEEAWAKNDRCVQESGIDEDNNGWRMSFYYSCMQGELD